MKLIASHALKHVSGAEGQFNFNVDVQNNTPCVNSSVAMQMNDNFRFQGQQQSCYDPVTNKTSNSAQIGFELQWK